MSIFEGLTWVDVGKQLALATDAELHEAARVLAAEELAHDALLQPLRTLETQMKSDIEDLEFRVSRMKDERQTISSKITRLHYPNEHLDKKRKLMDEEILRRFYADSVSVK